MHRRQISGKWQEVELTRQKEKENNREKNQNRVGRKTKFAKQLKSQETTG